MKLRPLLMFCLLLVLIPSLFAATTGKITGTVTDAESGEPLPGVNVVIQGSTMGAATNLNGVYTILNVPPGTFTLRATYIGYSSYVVENVQVDIDLTTTVDMQLQSEILAGQEVTVVATRPVVVQDISSSQANIEASQVEALPIQRVNEVVGVQAGVLGLSIRGAGADEMAFMLDGVTLRDERTNQPITNVSMSSIQAVKVQTGGFNAEYGNVRSGIVNVVTKEGQRDRYSGTLRFEYSPAYKKHFGPSGFAPDGYWNRPFLDDEVAWFGTNTWDLYTQRQYPQFDGFYAKSKQSLENDDPSDDLTPYGAQKVYKWQHRKQGDIKDPDYIFDGGLGGPVPFVGDKLGGLRFFLSHKREQDMLLIELNRAAYTDESTQLKLTSNVTDNTKLTLSALYGEISSVNNNNNGLAGYFRSPYSLAGNLSTRSYIDAIMYGTDYYCPTDIYNHSFAAKATHTFSSQTFIEASIERSGVMYNTEPNALRDTSTVLIIGGNYRLNEAPYGFQPLPSTGINGLRMGVGMSNSRDYSKSFNNNIRVDLTSQVNDNNQIKAGVEFNITNHQVEYGSVDITLPSGRPWSDWNTNPIRASGYIQDKIEFKGMIANLGVRYDYSNANDQWFAIDPYNRQFYTTAFNPNAEFEKNETESRSYLSPRLGISHPITINSKIYFNYGHFRSMPVSERLYNIQRFTDNSVNRIGDPNLQLSQTIAYELGYEHNILNEFLVRVAAYYNDKRHQPNSVQYISNDNTVRYFKAEDNFYEDVRGFELSLERRAGEWLTGIVNYTYQVSTWGYFGKLRLYENPADQREYDRQNIYQEKPLARPYFKANLALRTPLKFGPQIMGQHLLADWLTSIQFFWREGAYFTWVGGGSVPGVRDNAQYPDSYNMDLRLSKRFQLGDRYNIEFYINVNNALDTKSMSETAFIDGNDRRDYLNSLHWDEKVGRHIGGYSQYGLGYGDDEFGDLRPEGVAYDPFERLIDNPENDPGVAAQNNEIAARNERRLETKSYIDNPNLRWLYYLGPRDIFFGIKIDF